LKDKVMKINKKLFVDQILASLLIAFNQINLLNKD